MSLLSILILSPTAWAFNQPPSNLSATTFLDGGAPPGFHYLSYFIMIEGAKAVNNDGDTIPGFARANALTQLNQFYLLSNIRFLKARLGLDFLVPFVSASVKGSLGPVPLSANTSGLGDLVVGAAMQWDPVPVFGGHLFNRLEINFILPTGKYDSRIIANPGSNIHTFTPYYSVVWFFRPKWETSWRFIYSHHDKNDQTNIKPGQAFQFNYAISREVHPKIRIGIAGYFLQQLTEDRVNGMKSINSKERAVAIGPGIAYLGKGLTIMLSVPVEFEVRNRFKGYRSTLQLIHKF